MLTALITGGSRGIGAATVRAFISAGYRTAFFYLNSESAAQSLAAETGAYAIRCDVRDSVSVASACAEAKRQLGHIDVLVNNAGVAQQKLFTDITDDDWRTMLDTHLTGAFHTCRAVLPEMIPALALTTCCATSKTAMVMLKVFVISMTATKVLKTHLKNIHVSKFARLL